MVEDAITVLTLSGKILIIICLAALMLSFSSVASGAETGAARITVQAGQRLSAINPFVYGQQIEFMGPCIDGGLWAELLCNRKFGIPDENGDGLSENWIPVGGGKQATFALDPDNPYCPPYAQRIVILEAIEGKCVGVRQDSVYARLRQNYAGYVYLRSRDFDGRVRVGFGHSAGSLYAFTELGPVPSDWTRFEFTLVAPTEDPKASFQILASGKGTLWIGPVSLMCDGHENNLQKGVMDALRRSRPTHMRWPGGCYADRYHFEQALGPRDKRSMRFDEMWLAWSPNDFGTDEFIAFCRVIGAEPSITLNVRTGSPEEAAHWVEYCNGAVSTPYGAKRAANGHPEPYHVKYWSIGNEAWDYAAAEEYAEKVKLFAPAVKAVDPAITLTAVGRDLAWDRTVTGNAGQHFEWVSQHDYFPTVWAKDFGPEEKLTQDILLHPADLEKSMGSVAVLLDEIASKTGRRLVISLDEWNVWPPNELIQPMIGGTAKLPYDATLSAVVNDLQRGAALREGLHACGIFHMLYRMADRITGANVFTSCNELGIIRTDGQRTYSTPVQLAFELYRNHSGTHTVACDLDGPPARPAKEGASGGTLGCLDVVATTTTDGALLFVHVINRSLTEAIRATIKLDGFRAKQEGETWLLSSPSWSDENTFDHPDYVRIRHETIANLAESSEYVFPPYSAVTLALTRAE